MKPLPLLSYQSVAAMPIGLPRRRLGAGLRIPIFVENKKMVANRSEPERSLDTPPAELHELLAKVQELLIESQPTAALGLLARSSSGSPWVANARGVCLLQSGRAKDAVLLYRPLVVGPAGYLIREGVPTVFKVNYISALLGAENNAGAVAALSEMRGVKHPALDRLRAAIREWQKSFSLWETLNWYLGVPPNRPFTSDQLLGDVR